MSGETPWERLPGKPAFVWISAPTTKLSGPVEGLEVVLSKQASVVMAGVYPPNAPSEEWAVRGRADRDEEELRRAVSGALLAWVIGEEGDNRRRWWQLRMHTFADAHVWNRLPVGVDDGVLQAIRRLEGADRTRRSDAAVRWLHGRLSLPAAPGHGGVRVVALTAPGGALDEPTPCLLRGGGLDVSLAGGPGKWRVSNVRRQSTAHSESWTSALIHVDLEFFDASVRTKLRAEMREELNRLGEGKANTTFLARWNEYHELENRHALRRLKDFGYIEYDRWRHIDEVADVIRFFLRPRQEDHAALLDRLRSAEVSGEEVEMEATMDLPDVLGGSRSTGTGRVGAGLLDIETRPDTVVGQVVRVDPDQRTVDLRLAQPKDWVRGVGPGESRLQPPAQGFLHAAVHGDHRRLQRRKRAIDRVLRGDIPLPQLLPLLQGKPARGRDRGKPMAPLSDAARACFGDGRAPTKAQEMALDVALNTPDIAVIQGPPGTGKTQLIAALQVRLAEEKRQYAVVSRSILLTSFQHAAVDNLVERSRTWDLPAIKIDSRGRGSTAHVEQWLENTIAALEREVDRSDKSRRTLAVRELTREAVAYCTAPVPADELPQVLDRIAGLVRGLVSDELIERLNRLHAELDAARRVLAMHVDPRRETALRAARGLRASAVSFADDGPEMAAAALACFLRVDHLGADELELLRQAADWMPGDGDEPPFLERLAALRDDLLDRLSAPSQRLARPTVRDDVLELFNDLADDLDSRRRASAEGVELALLEYLDDLRGDPEAVKATLRLYTTSLAATCQQADSNLVREAKDGERLFDTVIVDEAARANPLDLLIPLTQAASRVVLVGDHNQLPHMLEPDVEEELVSQRADWVDLLRQSLFGQLFTLLAKDTGPGPKRAVRLDTQFRMHPVLGEFVGRNFYPGGLRSGRAPEDFAHGIERYRGLPAAWLSVPNAAGREQAGRSKARPVEARRIAEELKAVVGERPDLSIGVITFYSAQVRAIWRELERVGLAERVGREHRPVHAVRSLQVGTVDAFQGKEFDIVFLSVTRSNEIRRFTREQLQPDHPAHHDYVRWTRRTYGHLTLRNRLCVAMSRQQRLLVVVGDDALFAPGVAPEEVGALTDFLGLCAAGADGVLLHDAPVRSAAGQEV